MKSLLKFFLNDNRFHQRIKTNAITFTHTLLYSHTLIHIHSTHLHTHSHKLTITHTVTHTLSLERTFLFTLTQLTHFHTSLCSVADVTNTITAVLYLIFQRSRDAGGFSLLSAPHRVICYLGRRPNLQQIQNYLSFCSFAKNK